MCDGQKELWVFWTVFISRKKTALINFDLSKIKKHKSDWLLRCVFIFGCVSCTVALRVQQTAA